MSYDEQREQAAHDREVNEEWEEAKLDEEDAEDEDEAEDDYPLDPVDVAYERARFNGWAD